MQRSLEEAVGVDVDLDTGGAGGADTGEPITQYRLEARVAVRLDEEAAAVAAAQDGEWGGGRAEHRDPGQLRRGARHGARRKIGGFGIAGADDQRRQPAKGRQSG